MSQKTTVYFRRHQDGTIRFAGSEQSPTREAIERAKAFGLIVVELENCHSDQPFPAITAATVVCGEPAGEKTR